MRDGRGIRITVLAGAHCRGRHILVRLTQRAPLEAGGSLEALQEVLGHSSIVTTQRFARPGEAHVQAEAEKIGWLVTPWVTGRC